MNDEFRTAYEVVAEYAQRQDEREAKKASEGRAAHQRYLEEPSKSKPAKPASTGPHAVTVPELEAVIKIIAKEVAADRARLDALEARPAMKYAGVWDQAKVYNVGDFATFDGSLWCCTDANINVRPGSSEAWRLAVKRGRDGRDAKGSR